MEVLDWVVHGEETVPDKEHEVQEGPELDCLAVYCAIGAFAGPEAEVESQLDHISDLVGLGVGGGHCRGHNRVNYSQGGGFCPLDWEIFDPVGFELPGKALAKTGASLCVRGVSGIGHAIQEVGRCNCSPYLRNRLFPKSVHPALGVLGMTEPMTIDLEEFDARDGWILESRIDRHSGPEVGPLLIQPLLSRILSSAGLNGFLHSVEITQESSSGGRGEI